LAQSIRRQKWIRVRGRVQFFVINIRILSLPVLGLTTPGLVAPAGVIVPSVVHPGYLLDPEVANETVEDGALDNAGQVDSPWGFVLVARDAELQPLRVLELPSSIH
jgi:hypothetical protein